MVNKNESSEIGNLARRAFLRRAGLVAGAAGGAVALNAAVSGPAQAASGDNVILGQSNDSGIPGTTITASGSDATLTLTSTGAGSPLSLGPVSGAAFGGGKVGDLINSEGDLFYAHAIDPSDFTAGAVLGMVFSEVTATQTVAINPLRMLDTRTTVGRAHIVDGSLDSSGRLRAGHWLTLDLSTIGFFISVVGNLTSTAQLGDGFMAVNPTALAGKPSTSTVNFVRGQSIANGVTVAVNPDDGSLGIYTSQTSHVVFDVNAVNGPGPRYVNAPMPGSTAAATARMRSALRKNAATVH